ncbi:MAG: hypothetical protein OXQ92_14390 [Boseongicola sp.]|nr:hypothetical protein [Boseongicola sp.]MDD9978933.1 hypothetical protein [Boseongicola sp.]
MRRLAFLTLIALAACGSDGEPKPVEGGITVSGEARIGIAKAN